MINFARLLPQSIGPDRQEVERDNPGRPEQLEVRGDVGREEVRRDQGGYIGHEYAGEAEGARSSQACLRDIARELGFVDGRLAAGSQ